jgi:hypothetical protein
VWRALLGSPDAGPGRPGGDAQASPPGNRVAEMAETPLLALLGIGREDGRGGGRNLRKTDRGVCATRATRATQGSSEPRVQPLTIHQQDARRRPGVLRHGLRRSGPGETMGSLSNPDERPDRTGVRKNRLGREVISEGGGGRRVMSRRHRRQRQRMEKAKEAPRPPRRGRRAAEVAWMALLALLAAAFLLARLGPHPPRGPRREHARPWPGR